MEIQPEQIAELIWAIKSGSFSIGIAIIIGAVIA